MRILVIDDEKNIRRTMAMAIESMEHDVVSVASGAEAFKELRSVAFQVVFLDLKLHQESGLEVLAEVIAACASSCRRNNYRLRLDRDGS